MSLKKRDGRWCDGRQATYRDIHTLQNFLYIRKSSVIEKEIQTRCLGSVHEFTQWSSYPCRKKKKSEHQCCFREEDFRGIVGEAWRILRPDTQPPHVRGSQSHSTDGETEVWRPTTIMVTARSSQIAKLWSFTVSALHTTLSENKLSGSPLQNTQRHLR